MKIDNKNVKTPYKCKKCNENFIPTSISAFYGEKNCSADNLFRTTHLSNFWKCPVCLKTMRSEIDKELRNDTIIRHFSIYNIKLEIVRLNKERLVLSANNLYIMRCRKFIEAYLIECLDDLNVIKNERSAYRLGKELTEEYNIKCKVESDWLILGRVLVSIKIGENDKAYIELYEDALDKYNKYELLKKSIQKPDNTMYGRLKQNIRNSTSTMYEHEEIKVNEHEEVKVNGHGEVKVNG